MTLVQQLEKQESSGQVPVPAYAKWQRTLLAACILLAPLTISLYLVSWDESLRDALFASSSAGSIANVLHFIGGVAASFFLPLGYLGMSLLGMRRMPGIATVSVALSLIGWIPWSALIGLDDLAYGVNRIGSTPQLAALWAYVNGDAVMSTYLIIYIIGHLLSAVFIGYMLGRLRIVPAWAAWAFALTSPLTMLYFPIHNIDFQNALKYVICALWIIGAVPAAFAMVKGTEPLAATYGGPAVAAP